MNLDPNLDPNVGPNLDPLLLEILACPACHAPVRADEAASELHCTGCGLRYPVTDGIPDMLIEHAIRPEGPDDTAEPSER